MTAYQSRKLNLSDQPVLASQRSGEPPAQADAAAVAALDTRVGDAETAITDLDGDVGAIDTDLTAAEVAILALQSFAAAPVNLQGYKAGTRSVSATPAIAATDHVVAVDATAGAVTVNLPPLAGNAGRALIFKKIDASANAVTIDGDAAETIDGAATQALTTQWQTMRLIAGPSEWWII